MENKNIFYEKQKELIDLALEILKKEMPKYQKEYLELFYWKKIPPHISQPLQALKNKITFKPLYSKIKKELLISERRVKKLVEKFWFSFILKNLEQLKFLQNKIITKKIEEILENEIKRNNLK